jgi:hypothetical protein
VADVWLEQDLPQEDISAALEPALPPGIQLVSITEVENSEPALQVQVQASEYLVTLLDPTQGLDERIAELLSAGSIMREKRGKTYDLRPLVESITRQPNDEQGRTCILVRLAAREGATGRPEEVLLEMGVQPESAKVHRTRLFFAGGE